MRSTDAGSITRLCYHGTNVEIRPGDRVRLKRWFRSPLDGVVCYLPGVSPTGLASRSYPVFQFVAE